MSDHKLAEQSRLIAACQRVMYLIDTYVARPNGGNRHSIREALLELAAHEHQDIAALVEGMSVSVDVSTDDATEERRYFGTVTEAMEHPDGKHGLMLLVQDAEPNWDKESEQQAGEAVAWASIMGGKVMNTTHDKALAEQWKAMGGEVRPLFTHSQQPLTDEQVAKIEAEIWNVAWLDETEQQSNREFARAIQRELGITKDTK